MKKYPRFILWHGKAFRYDKTIEGKIRITSYKDQPYDVESEKVMTNWEIEYTKNREYEFSHEQAVLMDEFQNLLFS